MAENPIAGVITELRGLADQLEAEGVRPGFALRLTTLPRLTAGESGFTVELVKHRPVFAHLADGPGEKKLVTFHISTGAGEEIWQEWINCAAWDEFSAETEAAQAT